MTQLTWTKYVSLCGHDMMQLNAMEKPVLWKHNSVKTTQHGTQSPQGQAEHVDLSLLQYLQRVCQLNQEPGWCTRCVSSSLVFTLTLPSVQAEVTKGMVLGETALGR